MKKVKYYYDKHTLRYEKIEKSWRKHSLNAFVFLSLSAFFALGIVFVADKYIDSPRDKQRDRELAELKFRYQVLNEDIIQAENVLDGIVERDNNIYRTIFEAEPISENIRNAGVGGVNKYIDLENFDNADLMIESSKRMDKLKRQLYIQSKSFDELSKSIDKKEQMLSCIPAIQPVANKNLRRFASGFGYRIHPIYKTRKMHWGLDFTAPTGTDIYSTGNGVVKKVKYSRRGYGNHVVVEHCFGYETLYAHMHKIDVKRGQKISRGDILGLIGNTGTSTAPHLHYEVFKDGRKINPINYFYNDLSPEEYDKMIELSTSHNQSFD